MREEIRRNAPINQVVVTGYSINVYSGPGGSYSTIGYMYRQDVVDVYGIINEFYKIHFDGK